MWREALCLRVSGWDMAAIVGKEFVERATDSSHDIALSVLPSEGRKINSEIADFEIQNFPFGLGAEYEICPIDRVALPLKLLCGEVCNTPHRHL